jgi:hypothetical protein
VPTNIVRKLLRGFAFQGVRRTITGNDQKSPWSGGADWRECDWDKILHGSMVWRKTCLKQHVSMVLGSSKSNTKAVCGERVESVCAEGKRDVGEKIYKRECDALHSVK